MSDEQPSRRANRLAKATNANLEKLPDINSVLTKTHTPDFLKKDNSTQFITVERDIAKPKPVEQVVHDNVIAKPAKINKALYEMEKNMQQKYETFTNLMEIKLLAEGTENANFLEIQNYHNHNQNQEPSQHTQKPNKNNYHNQKPTENNVHNDAPPVNQELEDEIAQQTMPDFSSHGPDGQQKLLKHSKHIHKKGQPNKRTTKDKEKSRRMKGQSSIATWKPEMYMKLRQQFD
jgi:hypothetical protein